MKIIFALILLFSIFTPTFAQAEQTAQTAELPRVAVYVVSGDVGDSADSVATVGTVTQETRNALGTFILDALVQSERYRTIERSENFLNAIETEHIRQRSGEIDDNQISELGKQAGAQFLCVVDITEVSGEFQVSARIIDVETADVIASGVSSSSLRTLDDLKIVSAQVVYRMIGVRVRTDQNFELLTNQEQTALERSIEQTITQTMQTKQPRRTSYWVGLGLEVVGAGLLTYGLIEEMNVRNHIDDKKWDAADRSATNRNIGYVAGAAVLLSGITIHIFF